MRNVPLPDGIHQEAADPDPPTVPGVLERLEAIQHTFREEESPADLKKLTGEPDDLEGALSDLKRIHDGVACFNHLYRVITAEINKKIQQGGFFLDNDFLIQFDVAFAKRYLAAIREYADPSAIGATATPRCWRILFENRTDHKISRMQFAIHGVNCHVYMDLPIAVVQVCKDMGKTLDARTHEDYQKVNAIFYEKIPALRRHFENQVEREFDRSIARHFANHVSDFTVTEARNIAWFHAKKLWKAWGPEGNNDKFESAESHLDHFAAHVGRGVLARF